MPAATLTRSDLERIERTVLQVVGGLVAELGGPPARRTLTLDDSLDRDLGIGSGKIRRGATKDAYMAGALGRARPSVRGSRAPRDAGRISGSACTSAACSCSRCLCSGPWSS